MCHLQQVIFCGRWHFLIQSGPVDRISFCTLLLLAAVIAFSSVWSGPLQGGIAGGEAGHGCGGDKKSRSGGGQGRTSPTGASCPTMSAGRPWICRRIFNVSLTLTAESSTEMKARQGYRLRKMIWPAGAGKNLHKENSLPSAGSPFWKRNPRIRSRKESTSTFYYLDKPVKTRLSCDKQLGNGKYRESESDIYNKFIDFEWMPYPGNACCNESLFLAKAVSESGMTGEKNRRVLE